MNYYNEISKGYEDLYGQEQLEKAMFLSESHEFNEMDEILDVGSGTGSYLKIIKGKKTCIDPSEKLLGRNPYKKTVGKAEALPFKDKSFDYCISLTAVQNFDDVEKGIKEMARVAKRRIFVSTMERSKSTEKIESALKKLELKHNKKRFKKEVFYFIEPG
jgi:ubiquinone/menaquinone biosynthesis C-methylase UbiE